MKDNKICPKCGSNKIGQGKQTYQGKMYPLNIKTILGGSDVISDICTNCGYILEMKVEKAEQFK